MQGPGRPTFDPSQPPLGDDEAMLDWWEQLDQTEGAEEPQHLERAEPAQVEAEEQGGEPPRAAAAAPRAEHSPAERRSLFAGLSSDELARAFVLGEILGPPPSRRRRR